MAENLKNKDRESADSKIEEKKHSEIKYIVPPGLSLDFDHFQDHYKVAGDSPIMILGPTGVGKSLFLNIFTKLFEEEQLKEGKEPLIKWANCAHFGGVSSDPNIARSELFGHVKHAFAGANKDKKGLVDEANGGALILEEIGELPLEVQAMLLTFIETGEYRKVGGSSFEMANVRIVGATNRESVLREDFRYRFFPFYLPPLYERRKDILYYMHSKYPELILSLTKSEVLALLAYHWPGNVREIDRVAKLMLRSKISAERIEFDSQKDRRTFESGRLNRIDNRYTGLKGHLTGRVLKELSEWGGDVKLLESFLKPFRIGLSNKDTSPIFKDLPKVIKYEEDWFYYEDVDEIKNRFGVELITPLQPFDDAYRGFLGFCGLFMQDVFKNKNILENLDEAEWGYLDVEDLEYSESKEKRVDKLVRSIMKFLNGVDIDGYRWPKDLYEYWCALRKLKEKSEPEGVLDEIENEELMGAIEDLSEKELLRCYYRGLLKKSGGNVKRASKMAGIKETTFRSRLDKFAVKYRKNMQESENRIP